jgi:membrane protease YdiL (CAAX protease family)
VKKKKAVYSLILITVMLVTSNLKYVYAYLILGIDTYNSLSFYSKLFLTQVSQLMICIFTAYLLIRSAGKDFLEMMGMRRNVKEAFGTALFCASPMFFGYFFLTDTKINSDLFELFSKSIWPGFNEELLYRAFLFGLLIRLCGWNFWIALLVPGLLFATGHLYQAQSVNEAVRVFIFTTLAGAGFSIFYMGWKWNIWFPVFLHILLNFAWTFYSIPSNVLGSKQANLLRFITIGLGIYFTYKNMKVNKFSFKKIYE